MNDAPDALRIDKWLWHARFFKTRTLATKLVRDGKVRVNGERVAKAASTLKADDVLTFPQAKSIRIVRVLAMGTRRGPAPEAAALYEDMTPVEPKQPYDPGIPDKTQSRARREAASNKRRIPT